MAARDGLLAGTSGRRLRSRRRPRAAVVGIFGAAVLIGWMMLSAVGPASAVPAYVHGVAQACDACHHPVPESFAPCLTCHSNASTPNTACTACHPGKTTSGATCWACHAPGAPMPPPTNESCASCHGAAPHLGSSPACTSCHDVDPTPHHDAIDQQPPATCTSCHQHVGRESHGGQDCSACHSSDTHPSYPVVPAACNSCHAVGTFGQLDCLACHAGLPYNGVSDDDVHDAGIPDPPISGTSCTSCHPDKQEHAGTVPCVECHDQADAFHHGQAPSPGYPDCVDCHGQKLQHGTGLACPDCHVGAQHSADPQRPAASVCNACHAASSFGTRDCYRCHAPPVYHATPQVGSCASCHGSGRSYHAGKVSCGGCHSNIGSGHHLGRVATRSCTSKGCHVQQKHVGQVWCTGCHGRAQHDRTPLNLPADTWSVCQRCHSFTEQALAAGVTACSQCHDTTYHRADYRVGPCGECHDNMRHQDLVDCTLCHVNRGPGHHRVGKVGARACSDCHGGAELHASGTPTPLVDDCYVCHPGSVHGTLERASISVCEACHEGTKLHADGFRCTDCHWPAVHAAAPVSWEYGAQGPLPLNLPQEDDLQPEDPRDEFAGTGAELLLIEAAGLGLLGFGLLLRRRGRRDGLEGPYGPGGRAG